MLGKTILFILLGLLSTSALSLDHYKMVFDDIKNGKEGKVIKELAEGNSTHLTYLTSLGMNYIELAHNFNPKDCYKLNKNHDLISSW